MKRCKRRSRHHFRLRPGRRRDDLGAGQEGHPGHADRAIAGRRRGSARRHHPSADRGHAGQARPRKGDVLHRADRRHGSAAVSFPRPRHRQIDRGVRHQPAQGRGALSVCAAMGAVQAGARRAAAHQGERARRGAVFNKTHRAGADRRSCRSDSHQCRRRNRNAARQISDRQRRRLQHGAAPRRHRLRGLHLARALHQDRHQFRFRHHRPGLLHAQLFLRSRRVDQSVQGQRQRPARHLARRVSGAGSRRPTRRR